MSAQEIGLGILIALAVFYLARNIRNQVKSHNCDDCSLMDMKKESELKKEKT